MNDTIQAGVSVALVTIVITFLVVYCWAQIQSRKSRKELDESYRSLEAALEQWANRPKQVEKDDQSAASTREGPRQQQDVWEVAARRRPSEVWHLAARSPVGVPIGPVPSRGEWDPILVCPVCNSVLSGTDLVNLVGRERSGPTSRYLYEDVVRGYGGQHFYGKSPTDFSEGPVISGSGDYFGGGYEKGATYVAREAYLDNMPYATA